MEEDAPTFKIFLLGDSTVGKTSFMIRYLDDTFDDTLFTMGIDSRYKDLVRNNKKIFLRIYDTAGQERFRSIVKNYYKGADGILLMYDVTQLESFNSIKRWVEGIKENIKMEELGLIIVGNKCDLKKEKIITDEMKKELEDSLNIKIIEGSAKEKINVNESFEKLVDIMMEIKMKNNNLDKNKTIKLDNIEDLEDINKKEKCCLFRKKKKQKEIE